MVLLLISGSPAQERVIDQRVLNIDDDARGSINAGEFFHGQDGFKELGSAAAILFGDFDSHQAELEEFMDKTFFEDGFFIHLFNQRTNFVVSELADVVAKKNFIFGESGQRRGNGGLEGLGHMNSFRRRNGKPIILALYRPLSMLSPVLLRNATVL